MNQKPEDHLDRDLDELERAYAAVAGDEPPELIDQAILNRARRETEVASGRRPWSFGWIHGLTSAAVVVLAVAIYTHQPDPAEPEPMRVAKPPSSKLRDVEAEIRPLKIPAPEAAPESSSPAAAPELRRQAPADTAGFTGNEILENAARDASVERVEEPLAQGEQRDRADQDPDDPERWLERILELKRAGDTERLKLELEAFRRAWPDYPIPPELVD